MLSSRLYLCGKAASYCDEISQAPGFKRRVSFEFYAPLLRCFCLLQNEQVQAFIGTIEYHEHKKRRFPAVDLQYPLAENDALLMADEARRMLYKKEYERRAALYYQGQPPFDEVMAVIQKNLIRL